MIQFGQWHVAGEGIRRIIYKPGQTIMSMKIEFQNGAVGAAHSHPHEQITHVISGRLAMTLNVERREIGPGEQIVVPGDVVHEVEALEDTLILEVFTPLREALLSTMDQR